MPGARAPVASRAKKCTRVSHYRCTGNRHSLHNGFTVSFVLSLVIGLCCHHPRCDAQHRRQLDASVGASGPHDFAVRLSRVRLSRMPSTASRTQRS